VTPIFHVGDLSEVASLNIRENNDFILSNYKKINTFHDLSTLLMTTKNQAETRNRHTYVNQVTCAINSWV
jgi:hypothetical protein